jgi:hypothetical protein
MAWRAAVCAYSLVSPFCHLLLSDKSATAAVGAVVWSRCTSAACQCLTYDVRTTGMPCCAVVCAFSCLSPFCHLSLCGKSMTAAATATVGLLFWLAAHLLLSYALLKHYVVHMMYAQLACLFVLRYARSPACHLFVTFLLCDNSVTAAVGAVVRYRCTCSACQCFTYDVRTTCMPCCAATCAFSCLSPFCHFLLCGKSMTAAARATVGLLFWLAAHMLLSYA